MLSEQEIEFGEDLLEFGSGRVVEVDVLLPGGQHRLPGFAKLRDDARIGTGHPGFLIHFLESSNHEFDPLSATGMAWAPVVVSSLRVEAAEYARTGIRGPEGVGGKHICKLFVRERPPLVPTYHFAVEYLLEREDLSPATLFGNGYADLGANEVTKFVYRDREIPDIYLWKAQAYDLRLVAKEVTFSRNAHPLPFNVSRDVQFVEQAIGQKTKAVIYPGRPE